MLKHLVSTIFGAGTVFAIAAAPAAAADDMEAKVQMCAACHGQNGVPIDPKTTPIIWGQQSSYLFKQLHDYRSGDRDSPIMAPIAKSIDFADMRKLAAYFAAKPWPSKQAAAAAPAATPAATPVATAAAPEGIEMCKPCHQPNFEGGPPAPRLAGLSYEYLLGTMNAFADDKRTNNLDMPKFMRALTVSQREAMARYLSGL